MDSAILEEVLKYSSGPRYSIARYCWFRDMLLRYSKEGHDKLTMKAKMPDIIDDFFIALSEVLEEK